MTKSVIEEFEPGKGGDLILLPGKGYSRIPGYAPKHGRIIFRDAEGNDIIRVDGSGGIFVHDRPVTADLEVYRALVEWLEKADALAEPGVMEIQPGSMLD